MDNLDLVDISDLQINEEELLMEENLQKEDNNKDEIFIKKDRFIIGVYISLIVLVLLTIIIYFFGYELFKPIIKV